MVVGFLLLIVVVLATILLTVRQQLAHAMVSHTLVVENQIWLILSRLQDDETAERGFVLTNRHAFLQPYTHAATNVPLDIAQLRALVSDNPSQIAAVNPLFSRRRDSRGSIAHRRRTIPRQG